VSLSSLGIGVRTIFTTKELVDKISNMKSLHPRMTEKKMFYEKNGAAGQIFV